MLLILLAMFGVIQWSTVVFVIMSALSALSALIVVGALIVFTALWLWVCFTFGWRRGP